ncbi:MAG: M48 family metallopeptidase [Ruminococcaceae bacterium]|nr:M48 family metallopeptidase [Oscillospiraceae bacterium]
MYIQEKNKSVWETTLHVANTTSGEKILYDIDPIKKVEGPVKSGPTTTKKNIPYQASIVNTNSMQDTKKYSITKEVEVSSSEKVSDTDIMIDNAVKYGEQSSSAVTRDLAAQVKADKENGNLKDKKLGKLIRSIASKDVNLMKGPGESEKTGVELILSTLSKGMGGAELSDSELSLISSAPEAFTAYTGIKLNENKDEQIKAFFDNAKEKNKRANSIITAISEKTGLAFDYDVTLPAKVAGTYNPETKKITLNPGSPRALDYAVVHELVHFVENKKGFTGFQNGLMKSNYYLNEFLVKNNYQDEAAFRADMAETYKKAYAKLTPEQFNEAIDYEMTAKVAENLINSDIKALERLAKNDTGFKAVIREIVEFFEEIYHSLNGESEKAYALKKARELRKLTTQNDAMKGNDYIRYSIHNIKGFGNIVFLDKKLINASNFNSHKKAIKKFFVDNLKDKEITILESKDIVNIDQIGKYLYPGEKVERYSEKLTAIEILSDIVKIGKNKKHSKDLIVDGKTKKHAGYDALNGWDYYETNFCLDNSGIVYGGTIVVRKSKNGKDYFYDLNNIREVGYQDELKNYPVKYGQTSLKDNIPQKQSIVNTNSMQKDKKNSGKHISESAGKLTYDAERVILKYKSSDSYKINEKLYSCKPLSTSEKSFVEDLNKALDKIPKFAGKVYRNITFYFQGKEFFDEFVNSHIVGEKKCYHAFASASKTVDGYEIDADLTVHFEIDSVSAADIEQYGLVDEREVLFKTTVEFDVLSVENHGSYANIKLKEVSENVGYEKTDSAGNDGKNQDGFKTTGMGEGYNGNGKGIYHKTPIVRERGNSNDRILKEQSPGNSGRYGNNNRGYNLEGNPGIRDDSIGERQAVRKVEDIEKLSIEADRQVVFGNTKKEMSKNIEKYINTLLDQNGHLEIKAMDGSEILITETTAWKIADVKKSVNNNKIEMSDEEFAVKAHAGAHIDELLKVSKDQEKYTVDKKDHYYADYWGYRTVFFEDCDGGFYELDLSIGITPEEGNKAYNIGDIKSGTNKVIGSSAHSPGRLTENVNSTIDNIPQKKRQPRILCKVFTKPPR